MKKLIERLRLDIEREKMIDDPILDEISWRDQLGTIITMNEASQIIALYERGQNVSEQHSNCNLPQVSNCTCGIEVTTGWTEVKCCNICGKPIEGEVW
jgi:hypothetical protein